MSSLNDRKIKDVRDIWGCSGSESDKENPVLDENAESRSQKHKYKTLERHLSMKKTIRRKMMRDLQEIGDAQQLDNTQCVTTGFLEQIKNDQPAPANIDKPSLWKRLTKGWGH